MQFEDDMKQAKKHASPGSLAREYRASMPAGVLHLWAADAVSALRLQDAKIMALQCALEDAGCAINSMKAEAENGAQGDEQMMLEACEQISNEGLQASMEIAAALAPQESP